MITGLGYITGGSYEIRTSSNQAAGVYRLAARTMNQEIPVMTLKAQGLNRDGGSVALTDRILYIDFDYGYGICSDKNRDMTLCFVKTAQSGQTVGAAGAEPVSTRSWSSPEPRRPVSPPKRAARS